MVIYLIGLGLSGKKDISVLGLETLKNCDFTYLESYTSFLQDSAEELEKFYGKKIIPADREMVEKKADEILERAKTKDVAFLVAGDPMCATTHIDLILRAKQKNVRTEIIHNASIVSAIGVIGLEVYKYGKITSLPFHNDKVKGPVDVYEMNRKNGLHTLFLLDLDPIGRKFLSIKEAAAYLMKNGVVEDTLAIGCSRIGAPKKVIKVDSLRNLGKHDYGDAPYCIVIPGKMHFMEEEALGLWK